MYNTDISIASNYNIAIRVIIIVIHMVKNMINITHMNYDNRKQLMLKRIQHTKHNNSK